MEVAGEEGCDRLLVQLHHTPEIITTVLRLDPPAGIGVPVLVGGNMGDETPLMLPTMNFGHYEDAPVGGDGPLMLPSPM